jgi:hypothetical protein
MVVAHKDDRQAGSSLPTGRKLIRALTYFAPDFLGDLLSVDDRGGHGVGPKKGRHSVTPKRQRSRFRAAALRQGAQWLGKWRLCVFQPN